MPDTPVTGLIEHFTEIEDPRIDRRKEHKLIDVLVVAICAVICGADYWTDVESFGNAKMDWFETFLELPNGIPSHDTFGRVFAAIDPEQFQTCFINWIQAVSQVLDAEVVAVDGKALRRSHDWRRGKAAIHMVSAWATANRLVLGQRKVDDKSNEITAIPQLLRVLELAGCIVTIDAIGCQTDIAQTIVDQNADYILALKGNQGNLYEDTTEIFDYAAEVDFRNMEHDYHWTVDKGHGRIEIRECWTVPVDDYEGFIRIPRQWPNLQTIVKVTSQRRIGDQIEHETRYYLSSLESDAQRLLAMIRAHWGIENELHWVLDIAFREDESRVRKDHGPENLAILRHIALNLLKQEQTDKRGIRAKRLRAGWDEDYLLKVLSVLS
jgi:predicted transposase YbfD/YdcC